MLTLLLRGAPDPGNFALAARTGGDVRAAAWGACEQLLRATAALDPSSVTITLRFAFDPQRTRQERLRVTLELSGPHGTSGSGIVERLPEVGALTSVFSLDADSAPAHDALRARLAACCDVIRWEDCWLPDEERQRLNPAIPSRYYNIRPFAPREDNTWLGLDAFLASVREPAMVEVVVSPADVREERLWHYGYVTTLMGVNGYGDDLDPDGAHVEGVTERKVRDPMADEVLRDQEEMQRKLPEHHLRFAIRCWAATTETARLLAATVAEGAFVEGKYRLIPIAAGEEDWDDVCRASAQGEIVDAPGYDAMWRSDLRAGMRKLVRLPRLATVDELKGAFRLPLANPATPFRTLRRDRTDPRPLPRATDGSPIPSILMGYDSELGPVDSDAALPTDLSRLLEEGASGAPEVRLSLEQMKKHIFIAGVPGSGKTTAMNNLVTQLALHRLPFLVIEPAKTEYRLFKALRSHPDEHVRELARELRVYTVGNESISPFRFNPLAYPAGISLDEHISAVLTAFGAAMPLEGPMQGLLAEALEEVYADPPEGHRFPRLKHLVATARAIIARKGYSGEVRDNLSAALDVRLGLLVRRDLGRVFDCEIGIPDLHTLFTSPVVLEMDYLSAEQACLMTLFVLGALREHIRVTRRSGAPLTHVTFIEEAHNIVGHSGDAKASESNADPKAFAAQFVSRMLAELRALGEGMVIADQLPSAVAPEVVKNTGTKLAHRLVANQDREELGGTMVLDAAGIQELARLEVGEAYFYGEGFYRPKRMRATPSHTYLGRREGESRPHLPEPPGRLELVPLLLQDNWYTADANAREESVRHDLGVVRDAVRERIAEARDAVEDAVEWHVATELHTSPSDASIAEAVRRADALQAKAESLTSFKREIERTVTTALDGRTRLLLPAHAFEDWVEFRQAVSAELSELAGNVRRIEDTAIAIRRTTDSAYLRRRSA